MDTSSFVLVYLTGGIGSCVGLVVVLYNLVAAALYMREETEGHSSAVAVTAWAIGVLATLLWWLPCVGGVAAAVAIVVSRLERSRIYRDESPIAGATPVRMGIVNGTLALAMHAVLWLALLTSWLFG